MLQLTKILLPVDFSERCLRAAHYAKILACRFRSEVTMLHVLKPLEYIGGGWEAPGEWHRDRRQEIQRSLDRFLTDEFQDLPVRRIVLEGDPAQEIVELAHRQMLHLIVMPTHGYGPFRKFILGSVTAKVLHDADCPVLTGVHLGEGTQPESMFFRNIACAVDFGPQGAKALSWAAHLAADFQARLTVVHAVPRLDMGQVHYLELPVMLRRQAEEQMEDLQARTGVSAAEVYIDNGVVADVVRDAAECCKADLLVIGRHHEPGAVGRLRANAYAIVRQSPCPVVSV
jgi:nucleotide-binding universal stress UspA family protein